jgi:NAD(P)H-dependent flavin oxidoreductase YrpB (nitropropane dioxygenase family)
VYAGAAVGAIHDVPPAGELIERMAQEAEARLASIR